MSLWAREQNGKILELVDTDPTDRLISEDMSWVAISPDFADWVQTNWEIDQQGAVVVVDHLAFIAEVANRVSNKRWEKQTKGIFIFGNLFLSDPPNLGIVNGAVTSATIFEALPQDGPGGSLPPNGPGSFVANWKSLTGKVELNLNQLIAVGMFGVQYTQQCFDREDDITEAVKAALETTGTTEEKLRAAIAAYDAEINKDWPNNGQPVTVDPNE